MKQSLWNIISPNSELLSMRLAQALLWFASALLTAKDAESQMHFFLHQKQLA